MIAKAKEPATPAAMLTIEAIAAIEDRGIVTVELRDWHGSVQIRPLTLQQIHDCNKRATDPKRGGEIHQEKRNGWYLVEGMVSPKITIEIAEVWLTERAAGPVAQILGTILTESGLTETAREYAKSSAPEGSAS